jgi:hypothetical protein
MKPFRILLGLTGAVAILICQAPVLAADPHADKPPKVVPQNQDKGQLLHDLRGLPDSVKTLVMTFDQTRDKYLQQQQLLLIKLRQASTPDQREQIREQLQGNRQEFLADLKSFREELRADLQALKGKISHAEFGRIINAAHDPANEGGHRHRGQ